MPRILYGELRSTPCRSVLVVAKALDVDYQFIDVDFYGSAIHKSESFLEMNPAHTIPTLDDDGTHVFESRAILGYLVHKYGKNDSLYPKEATKKSTVDSWLFFDVSFYQSIADYIRPQVAGHEPDEVKEAIVRDKFSTLERRLSERPFVAGDQPTIADISIVTSLSVPPIFGLTYEGYPKLDAYVKRVRREVTVYEEAVREGEADLISFIHEYMAKNNK